MRNIILLLAHLLPATILMSQNKPSRFSIGINSGINANFWAVSYAETNNGPANHTYFYNKNLIGTAIGANISFRLSKKIDLCFDYSHITNAGKKNYTGTLGGADIYVTDFRLREIENIYSVGAKIYFNKKRSFFGETGICLDYLNSQTIAIENWSNYLTIDEKNYKNSKEVEGGLYFGCGFEKNIDTKFKLGIKTKAYYLASVNFLEAITITPFLTYSFTHK